MLAASRNLRQNVIKGRIWGRDAEFPDSPSPSLPSHPFTNPSYNSSSSSLDLSDEDSEELRRPQPSHRRGRVRGMVETFERSGSFSSESSLEDDGPYRREQGRWFKAVSTPEDPLTSSALVPQPLPLVSLSPMRPRTEEPTVEALLAEGERMGTWGARAWEEFDIAPGVTVKRVDVSPAPPTEVLPEAAELLLDQGTRRMDAFSTRHRGKQDRRVVTAIFTPAVNEAAVEVEQSPAVDIDGVQEQTDGVHSSSDINDDRPHTSATTRELALRAELAETRALVDVFKTRLEEVERKVAELHHAVQRADLKEVDRTPPTSLQTDMVPEQSVFANGVAREGFAGVVPSSPMIDASNSTEATGPQSLDLSAPIDALDLQHEEGQKASGDSPDGTAEPSLVSELPQYVLLVGLGVCAVVFRVIMKKAAGRGSGFSWRF